MMADPRRLKTVQLDKKQTCRSKSDRATPSWANWVRIGEGGNRLKLLMKNAGRDKNKNIAAIRVGTIFMTSVSGDNLWYW